MAWFGVNNWKLRYEDECRRTKYWQETSRIYQIASLEARRNQQAPERGVYRLVNKVKRLKLEIKKLKESLVEVRK